MTTAHRPTWKAAVGRAQEGGWTAGGSVSTSISALDVAAHTKLKTRSGQQLIDKKKALKESLLALEKAEASSSKHKIGKRPIVEAIEAEGRQKLLKQTTEVDEVALKKKYDDEDRGGDDSDGWSDVDRDASDKDSDLDASDSDSDDDDSDDDDDDEAALQAELAKIRAEREAVKAKAEAEAAAEEEEQMGEAAMIGNPLLASGEASAKMKRKWNEDVVFRNQAKGEPKPKKRFINDTVRNDFHKRFLNKFIR
ncbi:Spliceosome-associated protein CWC15 homolog [Seminavis robusta]|uniref:Spliceosome-associated protein CWC15 homolog n=1 Tax=Seminavis robusta TaxID=568900 RepID=A0A9N8EA02_9STRA|nr:Spliceosome-associated protein CWC15 homolog [Seminavis robusta]|eukprot:Sro671_g184970.1 Spliceosome-associated protein CWC15 homolog (252) ;mRNA; f:51025-51780